MSSLSDLIFALIQCYVLFADFANIHYIRQKEQKGLGDAVLCAKRHVGDEPFAVLLGDTICVPNAGEKPCTAQLADVYLKYKQPVVGVEVVPHHKIKDYGIIDGTLLEDNIYKINNIIEKPVPEEAPSNIGAMGRYLLTPEIFEILENTKPGRKGEIQLTDALSKYTDYLGVVSKSLRYDIGDIETWIVSNLKLLMQDERYKGIVSKTIGEMK